MSDQGSLLEALPLKCLLILCFPSSDGRGVCWGPSPVHRTCFKVRRGTFLHMVRLRATTSDCLPKSRQPSLSRKVSSGQPVKVPRSKVLVSPVGVPKFTGWSGRTPLAIVTSEPSLEVNKYNLVPISGCSPGLNGTDHASAGSLLLTWTSPLSGCATGGTSSPAAFQENLIQGLSAPF